MNIKAFFVDALSSALDLRIGTPDDVLRHVTPDVLAQHLPRPLWARLLTACLGALRVDAALVVETIGVPNFVEHIPPPIIWGCIADIAARSLKPPVEAAVPATVRTTPSGRTILAPPPEERAPAAASPPSPVAIGPSIPAPAPTPAANQPLQDLITELEQTDEARVSALRPRAPAAPRFRQSSTGGIAGRSLSARRPQAAAAPATPSTPPPPRSKRASTEPSIGDEPETNVQNGWGDREIAVDDSQLVDWQASDNNQHPSSSAITGDDDFSDLGSRKR